MKTSKSLKDLNPCVQQAWKTIALITENPFITSSSIQIVDDPLFPFLCKKSTSKWLQSQLSESELEILIVKSIQLINEENTPYIDLNGVPTQHFLWAARFNRFNHTQSKNSLFSQLNISDTIHIPIDTHRWNLINNEGINHRSNLTQPVIKNKRYFSNQYESDTDGDHKLEAKNLFRDTQYKRIRRLFSDDEKWKYFLEEDRKVPNSRYDKQSPLAYRTDPAMHYIGHASQLIQWQQLNILIDPVFGDLNPLLYPRKTEPGLLAEQLPVIDVILICHNHHDHCDIPSLKKLVPHQPIVIVPKGDGKLMKQIGFTHVLEQEWWQKATIQAAFNPELYFEFYSTPTWHWSGRSPFDSNSSLFLGWIIKPSCEKKGIYYAGDTARMPDRVYEEIQEYLPEIFINLEPGGPNQKRVDMEPTHQSIADSFETHFRLLTRGDSETYSKRVEELRTVIIHHNTFELGTDCFNDNLRIWKEIIRAVAEDLKEPENEYLRISWEVIQRLKKLPLSKGVLLNALENRIFFPKIGSVTPLYTES